MAGQIMGPDWSSDSEDSLFGDDEVYRKYKKKNFYAETEVNEQLALTKNLLYGINTGEIQQVSDYISKGGDINVDLQDRWTPIQLAASSCKIDIVKLLIEHGADVNSNRDESTLLMMACSSTIASHQQMLEVVQFLVEHGADVKAVNRRRMNALMMAAYNGNLLVVEYLWPISNQSHVDNQRWNALTWAVSTNQVEVVKYLYDQNCDYQLLDVRDNTPTDLAIEHGLNEILEIFPKIIINGEEFVPPLPLPFEECFQTQRPQFYDEMGHFLKAIQCDHLIPVFIESSVSFEQLLSCNEEDLKRNGVKLPYMRRRIMTGLHRFHKQPYHPKSLHNCLKSTSYSNIDVAIQLMSAVQQLQCMEASLKYILNQVTPKTLRNEEMITVKNIQTKVVQLKRVVKELNRKLDTWDMQPADEITMKSLKAFRNHQSSLTKRLLLSSCGIVTVILVCKFKMNLFSIFERILGK